MKTRQATLVVIEFGASWPRWLNPTHAGDMAVVAQHYAGEPGSLLAQVANRVTRLELQGWCLRAMVFVSNGACDGGAVAARSVLTRGLLARLKASGGGHFALTVDERLGQRARHNLTHLAERLDRELGAGGVALSVQIGGAAQHDDEARYDIDELVETDVDAAPVAC